MSTATTLAANAKTAISIAGGLVSTLVAATALFAYAPASFAGPGTAVLAGIEVLRAVNIWLVRNEPALENAVNAVSVVLDQGVKPTTAPPGPAEG